jgi:ketosteroid isomerase-like protein
MDDPTQTFPHQAGAEDRAFLENLLTEFDACVRAVDYTPAKKIWHERVLAFGTHMAVVEGLEQFVNEQWKSVWPTIDDFRFTLPDCRYLVASDRTMACVIAPWTSTGHGADGTPYPRPGRATLVFIMTPEGWRAIHSHMSLARGVPSPSHGNKPARSD